MFVINVTIQINHIFSNISISYGFLHISILRLNMGGHRVCHSNWTVLSNIEQRFLAVILSPEQFCVILDIKKVVMKMLK